MTGDPSIEVRLQVTVMKDRRARMVQELQFRTQFTGETREAGGVEMNNL